MDENEVDTMPFQIIRNDITKIRADAIVNTANPEPLIGRGTDSAVYAAAGRDRLLAARERIGAIAPGQAAYTDAFDLDAKYVIHTVGPVWIDGEHGERDVLRSCYVNSLALADRLLCKSAAFPLIASGTYGFPKDEALHIALTEIQRFLLDHEMKITLAVFDRKALELSESIVGGIEQYIDDHAVGALRERERGRGNGERRRRKAAAAEAGTPESADALVLSCSEVPAGALPDTAGKSLDELLRGAGESFQQRLFRLIDESGMDEVSVYKKANIDRKLFSHIRCDPDYRPNKNTALAFAIALELDMAATADLLSRAGFALSPHSRFDLIVAYFVSNGIYDIFEINAALFRYGLKTLSG